MYLIYCRGINLNGSTVGRAFIGTMCNARSSLGLTEDGGTRPLATVIAIASHEVGHNFNMRHDDGMYFHMIDRHTYCILKVSNKYHYYFAK